jgi:hypothetical protein
VVSNATYSGFKRRTLKSEVLIFFSVSFVKAFNDVKEGLNGDIKDFMIELIKVNWMS